MFGHGPQKLLCTWHVDRAWRGAVKNKIQYKELAALVYHNLQVLMKETEKDKFEELLQKTTEQFKTKEKLKNTLLNCMHPGRSNGLHAIR